MKQFHIINVGNSLLSNFKKTRDDIMKIPYNNEEVWRELSDDPTFLEDVYNFLLQDPKQHSAELNSFLSFIEMNGDIKNEDIHVYLIGTNTASNGICKYAIEEYLKRRNFILYTPTEFSGYFWDSMHTDIVGSPEEKFINDMSTLLDRIIELVRRKREAGFDVYINPTGGFKPHVVVAALAGFLTGCGVYYIHEEFKKVIEFPRLFYLPKGKEVELLNILSDRKPRSGMNFKKLLNKFGNEIDRLKVYGLVDTEVGNDGREYRIKITERGMLYYDFVKRIK